MLSHMSNYIIMLRFIPVMSFVCFCKSSDEGLRYQNGCEQSHLFKYLHTLTGVHKSILRCAILCGCSDLSSAEAFLAVYKSSPLTYYRDLSTIPSPKISININIKTGPCHWFGLRGPTLGSVIFHLS